MSVLDDLREQKCSGCGFRIMSAPAYGRGENACLSYNHVAMRMNLESTLKRCCKNPFVKLQPTIHQLDSGEWEVIVGVSGFATEQEAHTFWAFARKNDDWHLVSGEIVLQQAEGYGQSWPKERT